MTEKNLVRGMTRRTFIGGASIFAASALTMGLSGCAPSGGDSQAATQSYTAGTYTASFDGKNSAVEVSVTFSEDAITDIAIGEHYETVGVSDLALTKVPQAIIDEQSLAVDTVSGATLSSMAIINAVQDCVEQAGGNASALKSSKKDKPEPQSIEKTADVIVVGGGGAGTMAAISAAKQGASVIILEKADYLGGNTRVSGGIFNSADPEAQGSIEMTDTLRETVAAALDEDPANEVHAQLQADVKAQYDEYLASGSTSLFDTPEWHALQTYNGGDKIGNISLIRTLTGNALDSIHELESMGVEYKPEVDQAGGALWQRTHRPTGVLGSSYFNAYEKQIDALGDLVEIAHRAEAKSLIMDGSKVVGVTASDRDGNEYTFNAGKAVILATGGFAANVELRQEYCEGEKWPDLGSSLKSTNMPGVTGDGIFMARGAGANLVDMDQIQLLHSACMRNGDADWALKYSVGTSIFVNQEGERFINEDARRDELCLAIFEQTNKMMYIVQSGDTYPDPDEMIMNGGVPLAKCVSTGDAFVADTLDELAKMIDMPAGTLQKTVDAYNAAVESGEDEFGRKLLSTKLEKGPWYALNRAPSAHHTMGGIQIDTECHVIDSKGNPIEGLYGAGEVTGGIHGGNRLGGNAVADTVVFGRIAGYNAATEA